MEVQEYIDELNRLIKNHLTYTGSRVAEKILDNWKTELKNFRKVMPSDYKRVLQETTIKQKKVG